MAQDIWETRHTGILKAEKPFKLCLTCFPNLLLTEHLFLLFIYFEEHLLSFFRTKFLRHILWEMLTNLIY